MKVWQWKLHTMYLSSFSETKHTSDPTKVVSVCSHTYCLQQAITSTNVSLPSLNRQTWSQRVCSEHIGMYTVSLGPCQMPQQQPVSRDSSNVNEISTQWQLFTHNRQATRVLFRLDLASTVRVVPSPNLTIVVIVREFYPHLLWAPFITFDYNK